MFYDPRQLAEEDQEVTTQSVWWRIGAVPKGAPEFIVKGLGFSLVSLLGDFVCDPGVEKLKRIAANGSVMLIVLFFFWDHVCGDDDGDGKVDDDTCDVAGLFIRSPVAGATGLGFGMWKQLRDPGRVGKGGGRFAALLTALCAAAAATFAVALGGGEDDASGTGEGGAVDEVDAIVHALIANDSDGVFERDDGRPRPSLLSALRAERVLTARSLTQLTEGDLRSEPFSLPILAARRLLSAAAATAAAAEAEVGAEAEMKWSLAEETGGDHSAASEAGRIVTLPRKLVPRDIIEVSGCGGAATLNLNLPAVGDVLLHFNPRRGRVVRNHMEGSRWGGMESHGGDPFKDGEGDEWTYQVIISDDLAALQLTANGGKFADFKVRGRRSASEVTALEVLPNYRHQSKRSRDVVVVLKSEGGSTEVLLDLTRQRPATLS